MEIILPKINECERIFKAIAALDAIIMPEWEFRYYSFNSKWDIHEKMASMRDGSGSSYFSLFTNEGLIIKGFDKRQNRSFELPNAKPQGIYSDVPETFQEFLSEPAFDIENTTFCVWTQKKDEKWVGSKQYSKEDLQLLILLNTGAKGYVHWASDYYEKEIPLNVVMDIFDGKIINQRMISLLNSDISIQDVIEDLEEIGFLYDK